MLTEASSERQEHGRGGMDADGSPRCCRLPSNSQPVQWREREKLSDERACIVRVFHIACSFYNPPFNFRLAVRERFDPSGMEEGSRESVSNHPEWVDDSVHSRTPRYTCEAKAQLADRSRSIRRAPSGVDSPFLLSSSIPPTGPPRLESSPTSIPPRAFTNRQAANTDWRAARPSS